MPRSHGRTRARSADNRRPARPTVLLSSVSGTAISAGKIICGPGVAACSDIRMQGVWLQTPARSAYTCQDAGNVSALDCSPQPCTGTGGRGRGVVTTWDPRD
jgi:hypothetical protein